MIELDAHGLIAAATRPRDVGGPDTVAALLIDEVAAAPDRLALIGRGGRYTIAELDAEVDRAAAALAGLGIGPGDRVAMSLPNDVDNVIGFLAAMLLCAQPSLGECLVGPHPWDPFVAKFDVMLVATHPDDELVPFRGSPTVPRLARAEPDRQNQLDLDTQTER